MRRLSVTLAKEHHYRAERVLAELQRAYGDDQVEVTLAKQVDKDDLPGVAYGYETAYETEEAQLRDTLSRALRPDVLGVFGTDEFLMATLVYVDSGGRLMGPEDDRLAIVRQKGVELQDAMDENMEGGDGDEDALANALRSVFAEELDRSRR